MASVIQNTINNVLGNGARATKFECLIDFNSIHLFPESRDIVTLTKTSQFPGKSHEIIDLKYKGRSIPIKGQVKYDNTWSCTFYLTQDHKLKYAFENWIESLDQKHNFEKPTQDVETAQQENNISYATKLNIIQMDFDGTQQTAIYELYNVFPKSVSGIDVSYESVGQVLEFTVEFSYSHFKTKVVKSADGSFVDDAKNKVINEIKDVVGSVKNNITSALTDTMKEAKKVLFPETGDVKLKTPTLSTNNQVDMSPSGMINAMFT